ncbi:MAG: hypothetical protein BWY99_01783 [Synergistetes bacterium ADurb.BinA166]|nr:MAG: hypothetical protein BWY99_01783 [Synergistetes bacterium ADurb.BinA166]
MTEDSDRMGSDLRKPLYSPVASPRLPEREGGTLATESRTRRDETILSDPPCPRVIHGARTSASGRTVAPYSTALLSAIWLKSRGETVVLTRDHPLSEVAPLHTDPKKTRCAESARMSRSEVYGRAGACVLTVGTTPPATYSDTLPS